MPKKNSRFTRAKVATTSLFKESALFMIAPSKSVVYTGDKFPVLPYRILRPRAIHVKLMAEGGVGVVQLRLYDGAGNENKISPNVLVSQTFEKRMSLRWDPSNDALPKNWNRGLPLFDITNICAEKDSTAKIVGIVHFECWVEESEFSATCSWSIGE